METNLTLIDFNVQVKNLNQSGSFRIIETSFLLKLILKQKHQNYMFVLFIIHLNDFNDMQYNKKNFPLFIEK